MCCHKLLFIYFLVAVSWRGDGDDSTRDSDGWSELNLKWQTHPLYAWMLYRIAELWPITLLAIAARLSTHVGRDWIIEHQQECAQTILKFYGVFGVWRCILFCCWEKFNWLFEESERILPCRYYYRCNVKIILLMGLYAYTMSYLKNN